MRLRVIMRPVPLAVLVLFVAGAVPALSSPSSVTRHVGVSMRRVFMKPGVAVPHRALRSAPLRVADPVAYRREKARAEAGYRQWLREHPIAAAASRDSGRPTGVAGSLNQPGLDASNQAGPFTPPDTTGAVGPNDYVEMVNSELAIYSKSDLTTPTDTIQESDFVGAPSDLPCDGNIEWDEQGGRWLYSVISCDGDAPRGTLYFGWSKTSAPAFTASNWCQYAVDTGGSFDDYPKLGHDDSQILIGYNQFAGFESDSSRLGDSGIDSQIMVLDKPAAGDENCPDLATEQSTAVVLTVGGLEPGAAWTPVAVNLADSSPVGYAVAIDLDQTHLSLYTIGRDGNQANVLLDTQSVSVPEFCFPPTAPQKGTSHTLETMDTRLTQAVGVTDPNTGQEGIWTQHTVSALCKNGDARGPSAVRWYELEPGASTPTQTGMVRGRNGAFAWMGAISPSSDGQNAAIVYNTSSSTKFPDLHVRDRHLDTTPGRMIEDLRLATSTHPDRDRSCFGNDTCRWGDYSGASPDPSNASLVWASGELTVLPQLLDNDPQWGTENAAIDVTPAASYGLTVQVTDKRSGTGSVSSSPDGIASCTASCSFSYPYGTPVQLTATPGVDSVFAGWSGDCHGTGVCNVPLGGPQNVTATFLPQPESLSYTKSGAGLGLVTSSPAGLRCTSSCSVVFDIGTLVKLIAKAAVGSAFAHWSGDCSGSGACKVTMSAAKSATAVFSKLSCVVPNVVGKTVGTATRAIKRANCAAGKVTRRTSPVRRGHVISQRPVAGRHLAYGARIRVVVSAGR